MSKDVNGRTEERLKRLDELIGASSRPRTTKASREVNSKKFTGADPVAKSQKSQSIQGVAQNTALSSKKIPTKTDPEQSAAHIPIHQAANQAQQPNPDTNTQEKQPDSKREQAVKASPVITGYEKIMSSIEAQLPFKDRVISHIARTASLDSLGAVAAHTVLKPLPIIIAGATAVLGLLALTFYHSVYGFTISGSEMYLLFAIGWLFGQTINLISSLISTSRK